MNQETIPLQSTKALLNACLVAILLAVVVLFVAVLPAEYGIDPTGMGKKLGLTVLAGSVQKSGAALTVNCPKSAQFSVGAEADKSDIANQTLPANSGKQWQDTIKIVILPKKGLEYKFAMDKDAVLEYAWSTDGAPIYFDFHGEPKGAKNGYFKSYLETKLVESKGKLITPFEGIHGWYWENASEQPVTITLNSNGVYEKLGILE